LLALLSLTAYFALTLWLNVVGAGLMGLAAPVEPGGVSDLVFNNSSGPVYTSVWGALTSSAFLQTIEFWIILYALVAFIPLLAPRALILSVPWIALTLLSADHRFSGLGSQYTMVAAVPLFLGLAYGLVRVPLGRIDQPEVAAAPVPPPSSPPSGRLPPRLRRHQTGWWMGVVVAIVLGNLILNPMVPLIPATLGTLPLPFFSNYFEPSLTVEPGIQWVEELVAEIPAHATVGASNNLFPFVANDLAAYRLTSDSLVNLPFNYSGGPQYVLATDSTVTGGGANLTAALGNTTEYNLRGYVERTPVGPIVLFEKGFVGAPVLFGPEVAPAILTFSPGHGLNAAHSGVVESNASAPGGVAVGSNLVRNQLGLVANSTLGFLPIGTYTLTVSLALTRLNESASNRTLAAQLRVQGLGSPLLEENFTGSNVTLSGFTELTYTVTVRTIVVDVALDVDWKNVRFNVAVSDASWTPS